MRHPNPNIFVGNPLDRCGNERKDPDWLEAQRADPTALLLPFHQGMPLIDRGEPGSCLQWLTLEAVNMIPGTPELIFLGRMDGRGYWAVDATADEELFADLGTHTPLRNAGPFLPPDEVAIAGQALWLIDWHRRHRFCSRYGGETIIQEGGLKRVNPETGTEHFPRTDPVAIVVPTRDGQALLGRSPHFQPGMMSAFAGFLEACETLEECAVREVKEEVGLTVTSTEYMFSQPWPFPSSLMVGYIAEVADGELTLDPTEIAEARWFSKDEVSGLLHVEGPADIFIPPPLAIAHQLLKVWVTR